MFRPVTAVACVEGEPPVAFAGSEDGTLRKYANATEVGRPDVAPLLVLEGHAGAITAIVAVSADDVYTASIDGTVRQWNAASEVEGKREVRSLTFPTSLRALAVAGDIVYAGGSDGVLYVAASGAEPVGWTGHSDAILSISQFEGTMVCSGSADNQVRIWDASGRCQFLLLGHENRVKFVQLLSATAVFSASADETVRLWTIGEMVASTDGGQAAAEGAAEGDIANADSTINSAAATTAAAPARYVPVVRAVAVVPFLEQLQCAAIAGPNTFFGLTTGALMSVNTRDFQRTVADFQSRNRTVVREEKVRVEKERIDRSNKLRLKLRKNITAKKAALRKEERDLAAAAYAEKLRQFKEQQEENEEEEGAGAEEPPPEEEVADDAPLTQEHEDDLVAYTAEQERITQEGIEAQKAAAAKRIADVAPIADVVYTSAADAFYRLPFTRHYQTGFSDTIAALAVLGRNAVAASGATIKLSVVVPGVTTL